MSCSVVIRSYNEEKHIGRLLHGILEQNYKNIEIILVDSGSTDNTLSIAQNYPVKFVHILPEEFTFGYSLNKGISEASNEFIVIASAHVYPVYSDWIEQLLSPFANPKIALTYGKQRGSEKTHFSEQQIFSAWFPEQGQGYQHYPFCNNANAAIRRSLWEIHPYDERLTGLEDIAWANWCIQKSYMITYIPEAEVLHVHEGTLRSTYSRYKREAMAFKHIYTDQKFGLIDFIRLFCLNVIHDYKQALAKGVFSIYCLDIIQFRFLQFFGTYRGYKEKGPLTWKLRKSFYYPNLETKSPSDTIRALTPIKYSDLNKPSKLLPKEYQTENQD